MTSESSLFTLQHLLNSQNAKLLNLSHQSYASQNPEAQPLTTDSSQVNLGLGNNLCLSNVKGSNGDEVSKISLEIQAQEFKKTFQSSSMAKMNISKTVPPSLKRKALYVEGQDTLKKSKSYLSSSEQNVKIIVDGLVYIPVQQQIGDGDLVHESLVVSPGISLAYPLNILSQVESFFVKKVAPSSVNAGSVKGQTRNPQ